MTGNLEMADEKCVHTVRRTTTEQGYIGSARGPGLKRGSWVPGPDRIRFTGTANPREGPEMQQHKAGQHKLYSDSVNDALRAYAISIGVSRLRATQ